jgi:Leucine-rich repeat (LRR) protein
LDGLAAAPNLTNLYIQSNQLASIQELESLTGLARLSLFGMPDVSLSPIAHLTQLLRLDVTGSAVSDLEPLAALTSLWDLDISNTDVSDLSPLAQLAALSDLGLADTAVNDIGPLTAVSTLKHLDISGTDVISVTPLNGLPLETIMADRTRITSLDGLNRLPNIETISVNESAVTSLGSIDTLHPTLLEVKQNPLDSNALAMITRLCAAGWVIDWDGGTCGSICTLWVGSCSD